MAAYTQALGKKGGWGALNPREADAVSEILSRVKPRLRFPALCAYGYLVSKRRDEGGVPVSCVSDSELAAHTPKPTGEGNYRSAKQFRSAIKAGVLVEYGLVRVVSGRRETTRYSFPVLESVLGVRYSGTAQGEEKQDYPSPKVDFHGDSAPDLGGFEHEDYPEYPERVPNSSSKEGRGTGISVALNQAGEHSQVAGWYPDPAGHRCFNDDTPLLTDGALFACPECGEAWGTLTEAGFSH